MLIHLARGKLPWLFVDVRQGDNYINIFNCKRTISAKELIGSLPLGFVALVDYARNMDSSDVPDYDYIRRILSEVGDQNVNNFGRVIPKYSNMGYNEKKSYFMKAKSLAPNKQQNHLSPNFLAPKLPIKNLDSANNSKVGSESKTIGNYLKVCTNSMSVMNDSQIGSRFKKVMNNSRVVIIYEDERNNEEDKVEVIVFK
jgi:hypothetical protein